jgi:ferric-dicitrate binding protein FerR (iron transport regulator)
VRRIRRRQALGVAVLAALVAAFAVTAATVQAGSGLPTSIGKGEGRLNVI